MGRGEMRLVDFNWETLHFDNPNLESMDVPFSEEEVRVAINQMPNDKAPGPDGFTRIFFKNCWGIIKYDVMRAI
jgi:hypothetical protein